MLASFFTFGLLLSAASAQTTTALVLSGVTATTLTTAEVSTPTGTYITAGSQTPGLSTAILSTNYRVLNVSTSTVVSKTAASTILVGSHASSTGNATAVSSVSAATVTNTQACNNHVEFCDRRYSNITQICAHNFAFAVAGNAGSNQQFGIIAQLNDGIRMLEGETQYVNGTMYSCHTTCDLLNAGPLVNQLTTVREWVEAHPYDVVTLLLSNSDNVNVNNYTAPIMNAGLGPYLYYPPLVPMRLNDWPTLGEMILAGKRVVVFMDYNANQTEVPYILEQYTQMWQTPFSPTDPAFPCTIETPADLSDDAARNDFLYIANHNLNVGINLLGLDILIPDVADLAEVNGVSGNASLGLMANSCRSDWGRAPNFLVVDFYNYGEYGGRNGSVFEVAARINNVTYNRECCGMDTAVTSDASVTYVSLWMAMALLSISVVFTDLVQF